MFNTRLGDSGRPKYIGRSGSLSSLPEHPPLPVSGNWTPEHCRLRGVFLAAQRWDCLPNSLFASGHIPIED